MQVPNHLNTSSLPGRTIDIKGIEYLYFSGTSYLGIGHQVEFRNKLLEGMDIYGTIYSASRNNNVQLDIYENVESYLATINDAASAVTTSSGLLVGQLVMRWLQDAEIIYAPGVHPALWGDVRFHSPFSDFNEFCEQLPNVIESTNDKMVICANSIDPLKCKHVNFDWMQSLPEDKDITIVMDDSHAFGVFSYDNGTSESLHGKGSFAYFRKILHPKIKLIVISSLAKATGIPAGLVLSDKTSIENIKSTPFFAGASPAVPAYLYAFWKSKDTYDKAQKKLLENIQLFIHEMNSKILEFKYIDNYPVFYTTNNELYQRLYDNKIMISSFAYPNHLSPAITRIVISALHTHDDIKRLIGCI